nr:amidohydrolase family protein [Paenibacillus caui]
MSLFTLKIQDGKWTEVTAQSEELPAADAVLIDNWDGQEVPVLDLQGKTLLPGFVDAHMHLDKSFCLPQVGNVSGTLEEAVLNYSNFVPNITKADIKTRFKRSAMQAVSYGTTAMRTHLDFHAKYGADVVMRTVEAALEAREELAPFVDIQLFPLLPYNVLTDEALGVAEEALRMGVTGIGSAPHLSPTPEADIDRIFKLAEKYDCPVDFHTDESDDPTVKTLAYMTKRTIELGYSGRVTVDHLCSLAAMTWAEAEPLIAGMVEAGLFAVTLPGANMYLQGRHDDFPVRRGVTRVKALLEAGVPLATASDNIHDPFHPFGRGDLLQIGLLTAYAAHMGRPADLRVLLRMMTETPATILGLEDYGVKVGGKADFVVLDGETPEELFTQLPERRWICRGGSCIKLAMAKTGWLDPGLNRSWEEISAQFSFRPGIVSV